MGLLLRFRLAGSSLAPVEGGRRSAWRGKRPEREAERADGVGGLLLLHSLAGGTGSGVGAFLTEAMRDAFPVGPPPPALSFFFRLSFRSSTCLLC